MRTTFHTLIAALTISISSHAQDGLVDQTFANNAVYAFINSSELYGEFIFDVEIMPDGRIVLAGTAGDQTDNELIIARLLANGTPDNTFGTNGIKQFNFSPANTEDLVGIVLQGEKTVICAKASNQGSNDFIALRLNANGDVDNTFGDLGVKVVDIGNGTDDKPYTIRKDAQGRLLLAGSSEDTNGPNGPDLAVVRLTADGQLDNSFSTDGIFTWALTNNDDVVKDLVFDSSGNIFLVGEAVASGQRKVAVGALNESGSKILSYGGTNTGRALYEIAPGVDALVHKAIALENGGLLLVGGAYAGAFTGFAMQVDATGVLDPVFDSDGIGTMGIESEMNDVVSVIDGYIICGSIIADDNTTLNSLVIRLSKEGQVVNTFATNGMLKEDVVNLSSDAAYGIVLQGDDAAIVIGSADGGANGIAGYAFRISVEQVGLGVSHHGASAFAVYPNPTADHVTIQNPMGFYGDLRIIDPLGRVVGNEPINSGQSMRIQLPASTGMYTLQFVAKDGIVEHIKVLKH